MQISSNHSGVNFSSVYKSVVTRHTNAAVEQRPAPSLDVPSSGGEGESALTHHETLQLQAANRSAQRMADTLAEIPEV